MRVRIGYIEIPVRDPIRAADFFREALDWDAEQQAWSGGPYYRLRSRDGVVGPLGAGLLGARSGEFVTPLPVLHLEGGTLDELLRRIASAGGVIEELPRSVDELGRFARFRDSEGNLWGLWAAREGGD
jgi:predicted enzyme related to lactoylglutathione lyase